MSIDIERLADDDRERWNSFVERAPMANAFHRYEALELLAEYSGASLHALAGFKGQEPVGVFPVFGLRKGLVRTAFSPPPELRVPYLGPAYLNMAKLKQRKAERRRRRFIEGCLAYVDKALAPRFVHLRVDEGLEDLRPFLWNDFTARPQHTYLVDLSRDDEDLLAAFSSDARKNIDCEAPGLEIAEEGPAGIREIMAQVRRRYAVQSKEFDVPTDFVLDLHEALPDGALRPYVCRVDGSFAGGMLVPDDGDTVYRWMGGVKTEGVDLPVNDRLDWQVMCDGIDRGRSAYDLVGADDARINRYKAKFAPEIRRYHALRRGSILVSKLAQGYQKLR